MLTLPKVSVVALIALFSSLPLCAQDNGLKIQPDPRFDLAQKLLGRWQLDRSLSERLGAKGGADVIEFRPADDVIGRIPEKIAARMRKLDARLYLQGVMSEDHPFVLTVSSGSPMLVWFRERDGDPMGDSESYLLSFARGATSEQDLLFVGGDHANEPMAAYTRARAIVADGGAPGDMAPEAVLKHVTDLLQTKRVREMIETYCLPEDLKRLQARGETIESLIEKFDDERREMILEVLTAAAKQEPTWNAAKDEVTWHNQTGKGPDKLTLKKVDGRWYMKDR